MRLPLIQMFRKLMDQRAPSYKMCHLISRRDETDCSRMFLAASYPGATETWYLVNPTSGANNVVINFSANTRAEGSATSFTSTDITNPFGAMSSSTGASGNPSLSLATNYDYSTIYDNLF